MAWTKHDGTKCTCPRCMNQRITAARLDAEEGGFTIKQKKRLQEISVMAGGFQCGHEQCKSLVRAIRQFAADNKPHFPEWDAGNT